MSEPTSKFSTIRLESGFDVDTTRTESSSQSSLPPPKKPRQAKPIYGTHGSLHLTQATDEATDDFRMPNSVKHKVPKTHKPSMPYFIAQQPYAIPQIPVVPTNPYIEQNSAPVLVQQQDGTFMIQYPQSQIPTITYPRPLPAPIYPARPVNPGVPINPRRQRNAHESAPLTRPHMRRVGDKIYQKQDLKHQTPTDPHVHRHRHDNAATMHHASHRLQVNGNDLYQKGARIRNVMEHEAKSLRRDPFYARRIHSLTFGKGLWILLTEKIDQGLVFNQLCKKKRSGSNPPIQDIKKIYDKNNASIRQIVHGQGKWVIIADLIGEEASKWNQAFSFSKKFPKDKIFKAWKIGHRVSFLNYCDGWWVMITEKNLEVGANQRLVTRNKLPHDEFYAFWKEGLRVHVLAYGESKWVLIGEKLFSGDTTQTQTFYWSSEIPLEKIKKYYEEESRRIHTMAYASQEKIWAIITENKSKKSEQSIFVHSSWPSKEMQKMGLS